MCLLNHYGKVTPYDDIEQTLTNVDFSLVRFCRIHPKAIPPKLIIVIKTNAHKSITSKCFNKQNDTEVSLSYTSHIS